jgi:predicted nucleic acid-binding protein
VIVADASALVDLLLARPTAARVAQRLEPEPLIHAPHLVDTEVLNALRHWVHVAELTNERAQEALADLAALPMARHSHAPLSQRVWSLRERLSAYDATYVALAEGLDAMLVTADGRLARGAAGLVAVTDVSG